MWACNREFRDQSGRFNNRLREQILCLLRRFHRQQHRVKSEHHPHLLVFQIVAVHHEGSQPGAELHESLNFIVRAKYG